MFLSNDIFAQSDDFILLRCMKILITPNTLAFRPKSIIRKCSFPRGSYKESIDKLVLLHVSYRESQRFYYIIMYRCHLLYCGWPVIGQVFTDHMCLYKQIMKQWYRLQTLPDNMSNRRTILLLKCLILQCMDLMVAGVQSMHSEWTMWHFFLREQQETKVELLRRCKTIGVSNIDQLHRCHFYC